MHAARNNVEEISAYAYTKYNAGDASPTESPVCLDYACTHEGTALSRHLQERPIMSLDDYTQK